MGRERDIEMVVVGPKPKEHRLGKKGMVTDYPFRGMLLGDWFVVWTKREAAAARNAAGSFVKRRPGRKFAVRQREDGEWICRRVA